VLDEGTIAIPAALRRGAGWTSTFLASLELAKQGDVALAQEGLFGPIHIQRASIRFASPKSAGLMETWSPADRLYRFGMNRRVIARSSPGWPACSLPRLIPGARKNDALPPSPMSRNWPAQGRP